MQQALCEDIRYLQTILLHSRHNVNNVTSISTKMNYTYSYTRSYIQFDLHFP